MEKMRKSLWVMLFAAVAMVFVAGCAGGGDTPSVEGDDGVTERANTEPADGDEADDAVETVDEEAEELDGDTDEEEVVEELEPAADGDVAEEITEDTDGEEAVEEMEPEPELEPEPICTPGERSCYTDKKLEVCSDDGLQWNRVWCEGDAVCLENRCIDLLCQPDERLCTGKTIIQCDGTGTEVSIAETCDTRSICVDGYCMDLCQEAEVLLPDSLIVSSTVGEENTFSASSRCWNPTGTNVMHPAPDKMFQINLTRGQTVTFKVTSLTRHFDTTVYVLDTCDLLTPQCITGADVCCAGTPDIVTFTAPRTDTYWVVVDSWEDLSGEFELKVTGGAVPDVDPAVTALVNTWDEPSKQLTITATVANNGTENLPWLDLGFYPNQAIAQVAGQDTPYQTVRVSNLIAGEHRNVSIVINNPAVGEYTAWALIDPMQRIYDPDTSNNLGGPMGVVITGTQTEIPVTPPMIVNGRLQAEGEDVYYAFHCADGEVVALRLSVEEGSDLLPMMTIYGTDRVTVLQTVTLVSAEDLPLSTWMTCRPGGTYVVRVKAAVGAPVINRTGSYALGIAPLAGYNVFPASLKLFPGKSATVTVNGTWELNLLPPQELPQNSFTWLSLNENVATVTPQGVVTASPSVSEGLGSIAVTSGVDGLDAQYVQVDVSRQIPGVIYTSRDTFPINIPDASGFTTSIINVSNSAPLAQIFVGVSITHPDADQVTIRLFSPEGTEVTLKNSSVGGSNVLTVYGILTDPTGPGSLNDFVGEVPQGNWELRVSDSVNSITGRINSWRLYMVHQETQP